MHCCVTIAHKSTCCPVLQLQTSQLALKNANLTTSTKSSITGMHVAKNQVQILGPPPPPQAITVDKPVSSESQRDNSPPPRSYKHTPWNLGTCPQHIYAMIAVRLVKIPGPLVNCCYCRSVCVWPYVTLPSKLPGTTIAFKRHTHNHAWLKFGFQVCKVCSSKFRISQTPAFILVLIWIHAAPTQPRVCCHQASGTMRSTQQPDSRVTVCPVNP